jgi:dihydrofolate synthase / folylpolyglutamate synthase
MSAGRPAARAGAGWSPARAEQHLLSLELFGMRFGLDRMRRLLTALGSPQRRLRAVHVVGTNGKSSTVRMTAALLEAHGARTGCYLSPHLGTFAERIRIGDADVRPEAFAAAVQRAAGAAEKVDATSAPGDPVTQFELLTAAALWELARREVEVAVVEAGLGGRHDATNVLDAEVVVLTNVGLEHTRWLGPTLVDIAREKLAVVRPGATLVLGAVPEELEAEADATGARLVHAEGRPIPPADGGGRLRTGFGALAGFQRANFAAACAAAEAWLGRPLAGDRVEEVAAHVSVPGRLQVVSRRPLTVLDGAHNPAGVEALAAALGDLTGDRELVGVVSILDDKDAPAMLAALTPRLAAVVCTACSSPRALPPATLASLAGQLGVGRVEVEPDPHRALAQGLEIAGRTRGVVATGSIYLVADLLAPERRASTL